MRNAIRHRVLKGFQANVYGQVIVAVVQLAGVPILLYFWGTRLYGEWLILFAIPAYLSMTDLGFSMSAANDMTQRVARGDRAGALAVFQSLAVLILVVAGLGFVAVTALVYLLPFGRWFSLGLLTGAEVRGVLWLLAAEILVKLFGGVSHAGYRANGAYAFDAVIYSTTLLAQYVALWLAAALGQGPVAAAGAFLLVRMISVPTQAWWLLRRYPWLRFGAAHAHARILRQLVRPALANLTLPLGQAFNIQGLVLAVGGTLGPVAVVVFSTLRTLTRLVLQLVVGVSHAVEPELAMAYGRTDRKLLRGLYQGAVGASLWLALTAAVALHFLGPWILAAWTRGRVAIHPLLFDWLLASAVAGIFWHTSLTVLKAANLHLRAAGLFALVNALVVAGAFVVLRQTGRLPDAGLVLLVADAVMVLYTVNVAARLCDTRARNLLGRALNPLSILNAVPRGSHVR